MHQWFLTLFHSISPSAEITNLNLSAFLAKNVYPTFDFYVWKVESDYIFVR